MAQEWLWASQTLCQTESILFLSVPEEADSTQANCVGYFIARHGTDNGPGDSPNLLNATCPPRSLPRDSCLLDRALAWDSRALVLPLPLLKFLYYFVLQFPICIMQIIIPTLFAKCFDEEGYIRARYHYSIIYRAHMKIPGSELNFAFSSIPCPSLWPMRWVLHITEPKMEGEVQGVKNHMKKNQLSSLFRLERMEAGNVCAALPEPGHSEAMLEAYHKVATFFHLCPFISPSYPLHSPS